MKQNYIINNIEYPLKVLREHKDCVDVEIDGKVYRNIERLSVYKNLYDEVVLIYREKDKGSLTKLLRKKFWNIK